MPPPTNVRLLPSLQFKDGSVYSGQVLDDGNTSVPYGYGSMTTKEGFTQRGYFKQGKSQGAGIFRAPNGDTFYGRWNSQHKRHGKGLFVRAADALQLLEEYIEGQLTGKRTKRRIPTDNQTHWLATLDSKGGVVQHGQAPCSRSGHSVTLTADGAMIVVFGGETTVSNGTSIGSAGSIMQNLNDLHLFDIESCTWISPQVQGTIPPPMHGHTATLVDNNILIIIGGQLQGLEANSSVYALDLNTGIWSTVIHKGLPFVNHTASYIPNQHSIYILVQNSCFQFQLHSMTYTEVQLDGRQLYKCPRSFISHSATVIGGRDILVFGGKILGGVHHNTTGKRYDRCSADVRVLNTEMLTWSVPACQPPTMPRDDSPADNKDWSGFVTGDWDTPRCEHSAVLVGERYLCIIGGWTCSNPAMNIVDECWLADVQVLDCTTMQWLPSPTRQCPVFITPRSCSAVVQVGEQLWMFGGRNAAEETTDQWNILQLSHILLQREPAQAAAAPAVNNTEECKQQQ